MLPQSLYQMSFWMRGDSGLRRPDQGAQWLGEGALASYIQGEAANGVHRYGKVGTNGLTYVWFPMGHVWLMVPFVATGEALQKAFPALELRIETDTLASVAGRVARRECDVGIAGPLAQSEALERVAVGSVLLVPVAARGHRLATIDGAILDKPGTAPNAIAQLQRLQGKEHQLLTAVAIAHPGGLVEFVDATFLRMRPLTAAEIERYVAAEQPLDCAGSYKIEGLGIALFTRIQGEDQTAITGLPLLRLGQELRALGLCVP